MPTVTITNSTSVDGVWYSWVTTGTTTVSTTNRNTVTVAESAWTSWTGTNIDTNQYIRVEPKPTDPVVQAKREAAARIRALVRKREQRVVDRRAEQLLLSVLTEAQTLDWRRYGSFRVRGSEGGLYEMGCGWAGRLIQLDPVTGEPLRKLCIHPDMSFPLADRLVTLLLHLQTGEAEVVRRANAHAWHDREKERVRLRRFHRAA